MRIKIYKNTLLAVILFGFLQVNGQKRFDLTINGTSLDLDGESLTGFGSEFDFTRDEVRKGWWKYARQFGSPLDMRTYYEVTIPAAASDGNVDLLVFAQTIEEGGKTLFKIGLKEEKYKTQAKELLRVFKKDFYIQFYLAELKLKELAAQKYSSQYETALQEEEKSAALTLLNSTKQEMEFLKEEIRKVEQKK
ncbi:MAG: hypothetical protein ABJP45_06355 [Cyclobacteriaceae bacterium]